MKIHAGYEISYDCPQPTPMIMTLSVHPSRIADLLTLDRMRIDPPVLPNTYHDIFGNFCHVIRAPAGRLTMSADFIIQDKGEPDAMAPQAQQHALEVLPVDVLIYLLGSRYCETDRFSNTAWELFGQVPKGWPLVQAICDYVHDRIKFGYEHASPTKTAWDAHTERRGVCRDFAHLAITLCRCMNVPARYWHRLSRRHRRAARSRADGFFRLVRSLSRQPLVHVRCAPQHAAHRTHPDGARARRHRRRDRDLIRSVHSRQL
jgi:transglutaminase-like putative cysteine protease